MANEIKLQVMKTDGTVDELLVTPEQYVDMLTQVYKPKVKPAEPAPAFVQPPPAIPSTMPNMSDLHLDVPAGFFGNCDGQAGNYQSHNLINWLGPYAMRAAVKNQFAGQFEDPNERMKKWLVPIGAGLLGLLVGGCIIGFICSMKKSE